MVQVGIRALKQNSSAVVARAEAGEVITVTDRGRPVAMLGPLPDSRIAALTGAGWIRAAVRPGGLAELPEPVDLPGVSLSDELRAMREDEQY